MHVIKSMFINGLKSRLPVFSLIVLMALYTFPTPVAAAKKPLVDSSINSTLTGNRFLMITSDVGFGNRLAKILRELYGADVVIKTIDAYKSIIDRASFDAFVYYGGVYEQPPRQAFLDDMKRTSKPVLWINYHGWMLDQKYLATKGITIHDQHDYTSYTKIKMKQEYALTYTDTTFIKSKPEKIIYFLQSSSGKQIPGAVHTGNYTFISYSPRPDIFAPDFYPFYKAIQITFGYKTAPTHPKKASLNYQKRLSTARNDIFRTGVHLPVYAASSRYSFYGHGYDHDKWHKNLERIKQSGAEWVNLVRTFYQTDVKSSDVHADEYRTPTLITLKNIIQDAHELGLMVQIHLAINLNKRESDDWHGRIRPKNRHLWWANYQALVLEMAEFSKRNEVEALIIGTEYTGLQSHNNSWRTLIKMIRKQAQYPGMLGYGANYNSLDIAWLDRLDFLGISAYWPLSEDKDPSIEILNQSWQRINNKLGKWMTKHPSLRVEFTEAGYTSQPYASVHPFSWKPHKGKAQSLTEQLLCYRSLNDFLKQESKIKGIHIFASTADDDYPDSIGYTPFGKPAEKVLKQIMQIR